MWLGVTGCQIIWCSDVWLQLRVSCRDMALCRRLVWIFFDSSTNSKLFVSTRKKMQAAILLYLITLLALDWSRNLHFVSGLSLNSFSSMSAILSSSNDRADLFWKGTRSLLSRVRSAPGGKCLLHARYAHHFNQQRLGHRLLCIGFF